MFILTRKLVSFDLVSKSNKPPRTTPEARAWRTASVLCARVCQAASKLAGKLTRQERHRERQRRKCLGKELFAIARIQAKKSRQFCNILPLHHGHCWYAIDQSGRVEYAAMASQSVADMAKGTIDAASEATFDVVL